MASNERKIWRLCVGLPGGAVVIGPYGACGWRYFSGAIFSSSRLAVSGR